VAAAQTHQQYQAAKANRPSARTDRIVALLMAGSHAALRGEQPVRSAYEDRAILIL
jgi:hypothetical protein